MEYLDGVIGGNVNLTDKCWYYNLYISDNGVQVTAETIFNSMYRDGKNYDYKIESEYKFTGKSIHTQQHLQLLEL